MYVIQNIALIKGTCSIKTLHCVYNCNVLMEDPSYQSKVFIKYIFVNAVSRITYSYPDLNNMWCSIFKVKAKRGIVWESSLFCQSSTQMFKCKNLTCNEHFKYTMQWAKHKKKCNKVPPSMKYTHKNDFLSTQILK